MVRGGGGRDGKMCVIGCEYCDSNIVELAVPGKVMATKLDRSTVYFGDRDTKARFIVDDTTSPHGMHRKRVLLDGDKNHILSFRNKICTLHQRWLVYEKSSEDKKDLIFSAKQSKMMDSNGELKVFLANNKDEETCDFKVRSSSDKFYVYNSNSKVIAEIGSLVTVHPEVDQAFIISLVTILNGMNQQRQRNEDIVESVSQGVAIATTIAAAV